MQLRVSDKAPMFEAQSDSRETFSLSEVLGKSNVVLYFYPKDFTMGCTKEACVFRDNWSRVLSLGATVIGVSADSVESHQAFKKEHAIPFTLLSDPDQKIREMYGVKGRLLPPRVTFLIDKQGVIRFIFNSQLNVTKHVEEALRTLETLTSEAGTANLSGS